MVDTFWGQGFAETLQDHSGFCWSLVVATTSSDHLDFIRFHQIASEFIRLHIRLISSYYIKSLDLCPFGVEVPVVAQEAPMPFERLGTQTRCHILPLTGFHPPMSRGDSPRLVAFSVFQENLCASICAKTRKPWMPLCKRELQKSRGVGSRSFTEGACESWGCQPKCDSLSEQNVALLKRSPL